MFKCLPKKQLKIPFDLHDLFEGCRTFIMPKAAKKGLILHFYAEPAIRKMPLGDPARLSHALMNLLSNAVKFTNTGIVKLHSAIKDTQPGRWRKKTVTISFEVKDSGVGMTGEQIEKLWQDIYGGAGLGFSVTKDIVKMMGGKLAVESTAGLGSKFSFDLTFDTIDVSGTDTPWAEKIGVKNIPDEFEMPMFEGEVLLCEDNPMNQQIVCEHLARVGLKTVVAENGKIGVDMVQRRVNNNEKQFDLIFMDMHMPVMDGLEASSKILELNTGVPVVAITANIMANDREIYRRSGMHDCVGKPFTAQELWRCLMKYLTPASFDTSQKSSYVEADVEFQKSLKLYFVRNNQKKYEEIIDALNAGDIKLAHRLVHTLKSNAGQIGRILLEKAAAEVEQQLKEGKNLVSEDQLKTLETEMNVVLTELAPMLAEAAANADESGAIFDPHAAREVFEKLELLLKRGNPECLKYKDELRSIQGSGQLIQQMEDFEFESALGILEKMKKKMA